MPTMEELLWRIRAEGGPQAERQIESVERTAMQVSARSVSIGIGGLGITPRNIGVGGLGYVGGAGPAGLIFSAVAVGVTALAATIREGLSAAEQYAREVLSVKQLAGSTTREAAQFVSLGRVAGITDTQDLRELVNLSKSVFSQGGLQAMRGLGVSGPLPNNGIAVLQRVLPLLDKMPDGLRKTQIELQIFGARLTPALQPLLRMPAEIRNKALELAASVNTAQLMAVQNLQYSFALLGQTMLQRVVIPLVADLAPAIESVVRGLGTFAEFLGRFIERHPPSVGGGIVGGGLGAIIGGVALGGLIGNLPGAIVGGIIGGLAGFAFGNPTQDKSATTTKDHLRDIANNTGRSADALDELRGQLIGGGDRTRRAQSIIEVEFALSHALA